MHVLINCNEPRQVPYYLCDFEKKYVLFYLNRNNMFLILDCLTHALTLVF